MQQRPKAKYFCENCGAEVLSNARFCPKCGKFFSSVRCPKCGFTGDVKTFKNGCPQCGYAVPLAPLAGAPADAKHSKTLGRRSRKMLKKAFDSYEGVESKSTGSDMTDETPAWLFGVCVLILIGVIALVFWKCKS